MALCQKAKIAVILLFLGLSTKAYACSVCFAPIKDNPQIKGIMWAMLILLIIVSLVLAGILKFFWTIARREKVLMESSEGMDL